jgi:hypothetical protein
MKNRETQKKCRFFVISYKRPCNVDSNVEFLTWLNRLQYLLAMVRTMCLSQVYWIVTDCDLDDRISVPNSAWDQHLTIFHLPTTPHAL